MTSPATSQNLPNAAGLTPAPIEPIKHGFIDTGILFSLKIPYLVNQFRGPANSPGGWDTPYIARSERLPLFGFLVTPFLNHDISGPYSPIVFPDPFWAAANTDLTIRPYGMEHPLVRLFSAFAGWRGSLNFLITVNSTALVQGELAFIRAKYTGTGPFKWNYPQLEVEESDNLSLQTLATERRVMLSVPYDETSEFINSYHYWESTSGLPAGNRTNKSINAVRNYIFVRANTDITTLNPVGGSLQFKLYMEPGPDFEFVKPSLPLRHNFSRYISASDIFVPFVGSSLIVVAQIPLADPIRPLLIDNTWSSVTHSLDSATLTATISSSNRWWFDLKVYQPSAIVTKWHWLTSLTFGYTDPTLTSFFISGNIDGGPTTVIVTMPTGDLKYQLTLFQLLYNYAPINEITPKYFSPNP